MSAQSQLRWLTRSAIALLAAVSVTWSSAAWAAAGNIDHVQPGEDTVEVLFSLSNLSSTAPDLDSLTVTLDGAPLEAKAKLASEGTGTVRRTTVLVIDVSESMGKGGRIEQAKLAAKAFLDTAPADLYIGIVAFAGEVVVEQEPTLDREESAEIIDDLTLSFGTLLYDGVREALTSVGNEGQRNILVLSDGRDTSDTALADVVSEVSASDVRADVVALGLSPADDRLLEQIANAGGGHLLNAEDPQALSSVFASEAEALARQVLVTASLPPDSDATEGTLAVSVDAAGERYTDDAFVTVRTRTETRRAAPVELRPIVSDGFVATPTMMWASLAAVALGSLVVLMSAFGALEGDRRSSVEQRVDVYSRNAGGRKAAAKAAQNPQGMSAQAIQMAQRALESNKGLEASLGSRLEAAGLHFKPAEWLLMHIGVAFVSALLGLLMSSGNILIAALMFLLGLAGPWLYLGIRKRRRLAAFGKGLADTLQLMAGSLSAGLSLAQSVDTVVREGTEPIAGEFRRALVEARLGVDIEEGLESVAQRMQSDDFHWVVMAIRIQREVGGNLAELLLSVAATIRERDYLKRQVKALSAEGRLSATILGALPPVFLLYLSLVQFDYVKPMFTTPMGWIMLGGMTGMMAVGSFWLSKTVKVDV